MAWRNKSVVTVRIGIFFRFLFLGRETIVKRGGATVGRIRRRRGREEGFQSESDNILYLVTSCILRTWNYSLRVSFTVIDSRRYRVFPQCLSGFGIIVYHFHQHIII